MKTDEEVLLEQLTEELRQARNESPTQNRKSNEFFFKLKCVLCFSSNKKTNGQAYDSSNSLTWSKNVVYWINSALQSLYYSDYFPIMLLLLSTTGTRRFHPVSSTLVEVYG